MTRFVHCRGCGVQIHETATACPKCGAPQTAAAVMPAAASVTGSATRSAAPITSYDQVPWYRKQPFCILCMLVFIPAFALIAFTGDVYYVKKGQLKTYTKSSRIVLACIFALWIAVLLSS